MSKNYIPPKQGWIGQIFDSLFILALVYLSLYLPLFFKADATAAVAASASAKPTWASLNLSPIVQQQWEKLGYDAEKAAALISNRFDYTIDPVWLIITAIVIVGYFFFVIKISDKEYREVIAEKFGEH
jgi:succinate dehydrogenase hydrophobic anchor subunit